jgi:hypothetical protein
MRMKSKSLAATMLVAVGTSMALTMAAPAQADPTEDAGSEQIDQTFVQAASDKGVLFGSDAASIDLGHSTCDVLIRTSSVDNALRHIKNATEWKDIKKISTFGSLAVRAYCPTSMPK